MIVIYIYIYIKGYQYLLFYLKWEILKQKRYIFINEKYESEEGYVYSLKKKKMVAAGVYKVRDSFERESKSIYEWDSEENTISLASTQ